MNAAGAKKPTSPKYMNERGDPEEQKSTKGALFWLGSELLV